MWCFLVYRIDAWQFSYLGKVWCFLVSMYRWEVHKFVCEGKMWYLICRWKMWWFLCWWGWWWCLCMEDLVEDALVSCVHVCCFCVVVLCLDYWIWQNRTMMWLVCIARCRSGCSAWSQCMSKWMRGWMSSILLCMYLYLCARDVVKLSTLFLRMP